MPEIRCPKCGQVFQVDETGYDQIAQQVRDKEFEKELTRRKKELESQREQELEMLRLQEEKEHASSMTKKDAEITAKNQEITELQAKLSTSEMAKNLAVSEAIEKKNEEFTKEAKSHSVILAQKDAEISALSKEIIELQAKMDASEAAKKLAVAEAVEKKNVELTQKSTEIAELKGELKSKETESRLNEKALQEQYEEKLKLKDEQIEYYKDFKARQSTKMIGESLEQHCLKEGFARNYRLASEKFQTAVEEIDKSIDHLQKIKAALLSSENNPRLANKKADELSIKRLTKNAPSVRAMFDELK